MTVNGENKELLPGATLSQYLEQNGYRAERIAVERNGRIVPKAEYGQTVLEQNDTLEIVQFVGGG